MGTDPQHPSDPAVGILGCAEKPRSLGAPTGSEPLSSPWWGVGAAQTLFGVVGKECKLTLFAAKLVGLDRDTDVFWVDMDRK